jgi:hypothetical protein
VNSRINDLRLTIADLRSGIQNVLMGEDADVLIGNDNSVCKIGIAKAFPIEAWNKDWLQRNCRACVIPLWV